MNKYNRVIGLNDFKSGSAFLLGPRQVGKSTALRSFYPDSRIINLLKTEEYLSLLHDPTRLRSIAVEGGLTIIDEIQRIPELLNEVHYLIEERGARFLMTGSSARKLRRGGVNLLGGRARTFRLYPLSLIELGLDFNLEKALQIGMLPAAWTSDDPPILLSAYAADYLEQEIIAEAAVRNVAAFRRFLSLAALVSGKQINYTKLAADAQVKPTTLREHIEILIDSLVASRISPWRKGRARKVVASEKLYLFDIGVTRVLQERGSYPPNTPEYGEAFESLLYHELCCYSEYRSREPISYWRTTTTTVEVDFILGDRLAIEAKASRAISDNDLKGLRAIHSEAPFKARILVCQEPHERRSDDGILIVPFENFVRKLWDGAWS
jgi:predicted AAA+ superfamily ATPase